MPGLAAGCPGVMVSMVFPRAISVAPCPRDECAMKTTHYRDPKTLSRHRERTFTLDARWLLMIGNKDKLSGSFSSNGSPIIVFLDSPGESALRLIGNLGVS
jgi:hypothetical protein